MPRPDIPKSQKELVEDLHEKHTEFKANSFQEALSTVINLAEDALQRYHQGNREGFGIQIDENRSEITLELRDDSQLQFEYFNKGDPPNTAILDTGTAWIGQDPVEDAIEDIKEVNECSIGLTTGEITVKYNQNGEQPELIVEKILYSITNLVDSYEKEVLESKKTRQETREDAIAPYWPYIRRSQ